MMVLVSTMFECIVNILLIVPRVAKGKSVVNELYHSYKNMHGEHSVV